MVGKNYLRNEKDLNKYKILGNYQPHLRLALVNVRMVHILMFLLEIVSLCEQVIVFFRCMSHVRELLMNDREFERYEYPIENVLIYLQ